MEREPPLTLRLVTANRSERSACYYPVALVELCEVPPLFICLLGSQQLTCVYPARLIHFQFVWLS